MKIYTENKEQGVLIEATWEDLYGTLQKMLEPDERKEMSLEAFREGVELGSIDLSSRWFRMSEEWYEFISQKVTDGQALPIDMNIS